MNDEFPAIYEHGVLRPLTPLDLPEATRVTLVMRRTSDEEKPPQPADPLLGLMADEPDLVDQVLELAMTARESHPLRTGD